jgi:hypothetical protein
MALGNVGNRFLEVFLYCFVSKEAIEYKLQRRVKLLRDLVKTSCY